MFYSPIGRETESGVSSDFFFLKCVLLLWLVSVVGGSGLHWHSIEKRSQEQNEVPPFPHLALQEETGTKWLFVLFADDQIETWVISILRIFSRISAFDRRWTLRLAANSPELLQELSTSSRTQFACDSFFQAPLLYNLLTIKFPHLMIISVFKELCRAAITMVYLHQKDTWC